MATRKELVIKKRKRKRNSESGVWGIFIVDEHLEKYYHLHPEKIGKGEYRIGKILPNGFYKSIY